MHLRLFWSFRRLCGIRHQPFDRVERTHADASLPLSIGKSKCQPHHGLTGRFCHRPDTFRRPQKNSSQTRYAALRELIRAVGIRHHAFIHFSGP